jgi:ferredoxin-thioredoxin reductase catalytic subunit
MEEVSYLVVKNPDEKTRAEILKRIKENDGYCPCRFEKTEDTKCLCRAFRETDECVCGLFVKVPVMDVTEE